MKQAFLLLIFIGCFACSADDQKQKPSWVLEKDQMIAYLIDLHIVESKLIKLGITRDSTSKIFEHYEEALFKEHEITDTIYRNSFNYYLEDVNEMTAIYVAVVDSLMVREQLEKQNSEKNKKEKKDNK